MNFRKEDLPALMLPSTQSVTRRSAAAARSLRSVLASLSPPLDSSSPAAEATASSCSLRLSAWMSATWSAILLA